VQNHREVAVTRISEPDAAHTEIQLGGEIDLGNAGDLGSDLCDAVDRSDTSPVVIDISNVTFIDSSGIAMMLRVHRHTNGRSVTWRGAQPNVRRTLEVTGVDAVISLDG
jgi:anti-sigma B factor antagonist